MVKITVIGSMNMDIVMRCPRIPREGESLVGSDLCFIPGGKGGNQAVACKRMGAETVMAGRVGQDEFGHHLKQSLEKVGVDISNVIEDDDEKTGIALVMVLNNGNNAILVAAGANGRVSYRDVDRWLPVIKGSDAVLLQLEIPMLVNEYIVKKCCDFPSLLILDAGPAMKCSSEVISGVDILSPNEIEAEMMTGIRVNSLDSAKKAALRLLEIGAKKVVLKLGDQGSLFARENEIIHFPGIKVKAVDSTAAGDVFMGALAVKLAEGEGIHQSIKFANIAGALSTTRMGAQPSIPNREEIEIFFQENSIEENKV